MKKSARVHRKGTFSLSDMISKTRSQPNFPKVGAIATFIGVVRGETLEGHKVQRLELQAYEEKADEVLNGICQDLKKKPGIVDVQIHHMLGKFAVGEDLVYVLVAGSHREEVFPVLEKAVERYKKEAPIFKRESVVDVKGKKKTYWLAERKGHD